ncbi:MAG: DUF86 domain-containing protein [bacterium]
MTPEVLARKLTVMTKYLNELKKYSDISFDTYLKDHYAVERIFELLIITACDIIFHLLTKNNEPPPSTYSSAFIRAGKKGLIDRELSERLSKAAGMRNILVHGYEEIDDRLVYESIQGALKDFNQFVEEMKRNI